MTVQEAITTLKHVPMDERIQIIEILLRSLKNDIPKQKTPEHEPLSNMEWDQIRRLE